MTLTASGQTIISDGSGILKMSNISAPDAFGAGGPGTPPDFVSDDYVRVIGVSKKSGSNRYAFTNFFRVRAGGITPINNLIFTHTPPKKPDMLAAVPDAATLTAIGQTTHVRVTATYSMPAKQAHMPLLRSFASFFPWFYRHAAPTALWLGYRGSRVFQQAAKWMYMGANAAMSRRTLCPQCVIQRSLATRCEDSLS